MSVLPTERRTPMPPARFRSHPHDPDRDREELHLAALPSAAGHARRFVRARLHKWDLDRLAEACELVASELVTNAVTATGSRTIPSGHTALHDRTPAVIVLQLRLTRHRLVCEVWDSSPLPPVPTTVPGLLDENGRGLFLVAAYAMGWNSYSSPAGGKVVLAWWNPWATDRALVAG
ncbi:Anti-sigma regulatory factor (Ser/Thr protein kinase) [Thermomonospora echinospora]|uniref:Anti-sigma regulatory factor (Ser/Thr protein kinase) n=1 Tax=Thermomonospora echinospora TaxID=1992 RepID=A0A1H6AKX3_9ACTN|nr:ATP-binding protein [Thermomonospora echinospora]SEG48396.1 Anti-sigma regulatory factor (Ser/Thr protein kinase) [Thermomonospora echinospora]